MDRFEFMAVNSAIGVRQAERVIRMKCRCRLQWYWRSGICWYHHHFRRCSLDLSCRYSMNRSQFPCLTSNLEHMKNLEMTIKKPVVSSWLLLEHILPSLPAAPPSEWSEPVDLVPVLTDALLESPESGVFNFDFWLGMGWPLSWDNIFRIVSIWP